MSFSYSSRISSISYFSRAIRSRPMPKAKICQRAFRAGYEDKVPSSSFPVLLHDTGLTGRGLGAQYDSLVDVEGVLLILCRVAVGNIQFFEVVKIVLNLRAFHHLIAHAVLEQAKKKMEALVREEKLKAEVIDVTLPSKKNRVGHRRMATRTSFSVFKLSADCICFMACSRIFCNFSFILFSFLPFLGVFYFRGIFMEAGETVTIHTHASFCKVLFDKGANCKRAGDIPSLEEDESST